MFGIVFVSFIAEDDHSEDTDHKDNTVI